MEIIDTATRQRLVERFGLRAIGWCENLPEQVAHLTQRWNLRITCPLSNGLSGCVLLCEFPGGPAAVLKLSPDLVLIGAEASALVAWQDSGRVPRVLEFDPESGALLMEAVRPGTPLGGGFAASRLVEIVELVQHLHATPDEEVMERFPPLTERVEFIFAFWGEKLRENHSVSSQVPYELVERSLATASILAAGSDRKALLHGDLHAGNVLESDRGLIAVDPRACVGDPAFDLIDWVFVSGGDGRQLALRAEWLAGEASVDPERLWQWCTSTVVLVVISRLAAGRDVPRKLLRLADNRV